MENFKGKSELEQLNAALAKFEKGLGPDGRAAAMEKFKADFKPATAEEQTVAAVKRFAQALPSAVDEGSEDRKAKINKFRAEFKPKTEADQRAAARAALVKSLPAENERDKKVVKFKEDFKATSVDDQKQAALEAVKAKLTAKLQEQKDTDEKYAETMKKCTEGMLKLGTVKQATCMISAKSKAEAEQCRNQR